MRCWSRTSWPCRLRQRAGHGVDRRRRGAGEEGRGRDEPALPGPGGPLRSSRAATVLRPGLPDTAAGRRRDVPERQLAVAVPPGRPRFHRVAAPGRWQLARHGPRGVSVGTVGRSGPVDPGLVRRGPAGARVVCAGLPDVVPRAVGRAAPAPSGGGARRGRVREVGDDERGGCSPRAVRTDPWRARELGRGAVGRGATDSPCAGADRRLNAGVAREMTLGWAQPLGRPRRVEPEEGEGTVVWDRLRTPTATVRVHGQVHRVSAVCPHLGGILRRNDAERSWDCPRHRSRFTAPGERVEGPATCGLRARP